MDLSENEALFKRAVRVLPSGVNSPVRAYRAVGGAPLVIRSAAGADIVDEDGRSFLDFVCSWGPLILGHAHPEVVAVIRESAGRGTTYGAPCCSEIELAEHVVAAYHARATRRHGQTSLRGARRPRRGAVAPHARAVAA
mgnify:CR=1 FL=1